MPGRDAGAEQRDHALARPRKQRGRRSGSGLSCGLARRAAARGGNRSRAAGAWRGSGGSARSRFAEVAGEWASRFTHFHGRRSVQLPEDMGSGLAWGDYDGDG